MKLDGQHKGALGHITYGMGHTMSVKGHITGVMGHTTSIMGHTTSVMGYTTSVMGHKTSVMGHTTGVMGHTTSAMGHTTSVMGHTTRVMDLMTSSDIIKVPNGLYQIIIKCRIKVGKGVIHDASHCHIVVAVMRAHGWTRVDYSLRAKQRIPLFDYRQSNEYNKKVKHNIIC